jgi:hypothetical protein
LSNVGRILLFATQILCASSVSEVRDSATVLSSGRTIFAQQKPSRGKRDAPQESKLGRKGDNYMEYLVVLATMTMIVAYALIIARSLPKT